MRLARQFALIEERERAASRALSGTSPESVTENVTDRDADLKRMWIGLRNVYREGRDIVGEQYAAIAEVCGDRGDTHRDDV